MSYYISSGRENKMYTLRYKWREQYISDGASIIDREHDYYICTLSKFPDVALEKAKAYIADLGFDVECDFNVDFALNDNETGAAAARAFDISQKIMISGKYQGTKVEDLPVKYLKWCYVNLHSGVNSEIIKNYIEEFDLFNGWVNETAIHLYAELKDHREMLLDRMKNKIIQFGNKEYKQKMSEKTSDYLRKNIVNVHRDTCRSFLKSDIENRVFNLDLVDTYIASGFSLKSNDVNNFYVAFHLCSMYFTGKPVVIGEVSFEKLVETLKTNLNARKYILENA